MKKRKTLKKQYIRTFILALVLSVSCSFIALLAFYVLFHRYSGFHSLELQNKKMAEIVEFVNDNNDAIIRGESEGLKSLANEIGVHYNIRDMGNHLLSSSEQDGSLVKHPYAFELLEELRHYSTHSDSLVIPLVDRATLETRLFLVVTQKTDASFQLVYLIELIIPVIVFTSFILLFSSIFSSKLKKPLGVLMEAVEKIKSRDLDFVIKSGQDDEIGELAGAFDEMRENLKRSLMREWQMEQDRRDMVAAITHDLRTPLSIIQGHVEGLQDGLKYDNEKLHQYLGMIMDNSQRAKKLIDEMNELSEFEGEGFNVDLIETDIVKFVSDKFGEIRILCGQKGVELSTELIISEGASIRYYVDPGRLSQVLDNIAGNSMRFTPAGGKIDFYVSLETERACFRITDTGPGFSDQDLADAFKKFYKGDPSRSLEKGHLGLGLYIAESIIRMHGGAVRACNNLTGGACLEFDIPGTALPQLDRNGV